MCWMLRISPARCLKFCASLPFTKSNLAALMSRPTKKGMGTYNFYLEVSVDKAQLPVLQATIRALKRDFTLKILGEYAAL